MNFILLILLFYKVYFISGAWVPEDFPNPYKFPERCGDYKSLVQSASICDPNKYLNNEQIMENNRIIDQMKNQYSVSCPNIVGVQIAIAIMNNIDDSINIKEMATILYDKWEVGFEDCQNGLFLAISVDQKKLYIVTGRDLKNTITTAHIPELIQIMKPYLANNQYYDAISAFLKGVHSILSVGTTDTDSSYNAFLFLLLVAIVIGIFVIIGRYKYQQKNRFTTILQSIEQIRREKEHNILRRMSSSGTQGNCISCPICLEDFIDQETTVLFCGHKYCRKCIEKKKGENCPICSLNIYYDEKHSPNDNYHNINSFTSLLPTTTPLSTDSANSTPRSTDSVFSPIESELTFRLENLHSQYPNYLSNRQIEHWKKSNYSIPFLPRDRQNSCVSPFHSFISGTQETPKSPTSLSNW